MGGVQKGAQEVHGRYMHGRCMEGAQKVHGRCVGGTQEVCGMCMEGEQKRLFIIICPSNQWFNE